MVSNVRILVPFLRSLFSAFLTRYCICGAFLLAVVVLISGRWRWPTQSTR
jgi:hypothetical protein